MKKFLFFSSAFLMTMAGAHAADKIITSENTCTVDVLGVSDNNAVANTIATWGLIDYECPDGQYLLETETSVECTPCPTGSYCPGGTYTVESENMGTNICPSGYPNSDAGASADTQCYTACTVDMVAKATAVTGNDYYDTGVDTCGAMACEMGYEVDGGSIELVEKTPLAPISLTDEGMGSAAVQITGDPYDYNFSDSGLTEKGTWATAYSEGVVYGKASCQPASNDAAITYVMSTYQSVLGGGMTIEEYKSGLEPIVGSVLTDYAADTLLGVMNGTKTEKDMYEATFVTLGTKKDANYSTDSVGEYCYCQMDGFTPTGGTKAIVTSAPWVFSAPYGSADNCASDCASDCASLLRSVSGENLAIRVAVFGALESVETGGMCKITENNCPAGQYLVKTETDISCQPCPIGSYCPGGTYTVESENMGDVSCPTSHPWSLPGAGTDTQCFELCTVNKANIAHATAVSGPDYYGAGIDACYPTACETGYDAIFAQYDYKLGSNDHGYIAANMSGDSNAEKYGLSASNTWVSEFDYGLVYGNASCQPTMDPAIGYIMMNSGALLSGQMSLDEFTAGLEPLAGSAKTQYMENLLIDFTAGRITAQDLYNGVWQEFFAEPGADYRTSDTGQYCYCQMDAVAFSGVNKTAVTSAPWVFRINYDSNESCASDCANNCASQGSGDIDMAFRFVAYAALELGGGGMCKVIETECPMGQYLSVVGDAMMCVPCKSGSYCPGGTYTVENAGSGTNVCPSGYTQSDAGAVSDSQCYRACSFDMVAKATAVTGNDYYGTGTDTCSATSCVTGYHVSKGIKIVDKTPVIPFDVSGAVNSIEYNEIDGGPSFDPQGELDYGEWAVRYDWGSVYGKASCSYLPLETINLVNRFRNGAISQSEFVYYLGLDSEKADYLSKIDVNDTDALNKALYTLLYTEKEIIPDSNGFCYCQINGFTPSGGTKVPVESEMWVYNDTFDEIPVNHEECYRRFWDWYPECSQYYDCDPNYPGAGAWDPELDPERYQLCAVDFVESGCEALYHEHANRMNYICDVPMEYNYDNCYYCASQCANAFAGEPYVNSYEDIFKDLMIGALGYTEASVCSANIINIDWNPDNNGEHIKNMCTYEGSITVPADPVKPGFTFAGWKLVE